MMSDQETPVVDAPRAEPSSRRARRWTILGWIAVVVAMVAWTGVNVRFGVSWKDRWTPTASSSQNWDSGDVTLSVAKVWVERTIPARNEFSQPKTAAPGAVWVIVLLDYTLADPAVGTYCTLYLRGEGREWFSTATSPSPVISDVAPGARYGCNNKDSDDKPVDRGQFGQVFEVPESVLSEITGLRVIAGQQPTNMFDVSEALRLHSASVVLPLDIPS